MKTIKQFIQQKNNLIKKLKKYIPIQVATNSDYNNQKEDMIGSFNFFEDINSPASFFDNRNGLFGTNEFIIL